MASFKKIAIFGATSGIGKALAERYIENGTFVVAIGRRVENLNELVEKYGIDKVDGVPFDIAKVDEIPRFVEELCKSHEDLDCAFMNSGIQRGWDFSKPDTIKMDGIKEELTINYLAQLTLTKAFIPFFQSKSSETALMYTTSGLGLVPSPRVPNYSATKAAMHAFILVIREQLRTSKIRVIEIIPPLVQTEIHSSKNQPDIQGGENMGMPLDEYTDKTWQGLVAGKDQIPVGTAEEAYEKFELERQKVFQTMFLTPGENSQTIK